LAARRVVRPKIALRLQQGLYPLHRALVAEIKIERTFSLDLQFECRWDADSRPETRNLQIDRTTLRKKSPTYQLLRGELKGRAGAHRNPVVGVAEVAAMEVGESVTTIQVLSQIMVSCR
jgi:hypothetical protein